MIWFKSKSIDPDRKELATSNSKLPREGRRSCAPPTRRFGGAGLGPQIPRHSPPTGCHNLRLSQSIFRLVLGRRLMMMSAALRARGSAPKWPADARRRLLRPGLGLVVARFGWVSPAFPPTLWAVSRRQVGRGFLARSRLCGALRGQVPVGQAKRIRAAGAPSRVWVWARLHLPSIWAKYPDFTLTSHKPRWWFLNVLKHPFLRELRMFQSSIYLETSLVRSGTGWPLCGGKGHSSKSPQLEYPLLLAAKTESWFLSELLI